MPSNLLAMASNLLCKRFASLRFQNATMVTFSVWLLYIYIYVDL